MAELSSKMDAVASSTIPNSTTTTSTTTTTDNNNDTTIINSSLDAMVHPQQKSKDSPENLQQKVQDISDPLQANVQVYKSNLEYLIEKQNLEIKYGIQNESDQGYFRTVIVGRKKPIDLTNTVVETIDAHDRTNNTSKKAKYDDEKTSKPLSHLDIQVHLSSDWKLLGVGLDPSRHGSIRMAIAVAWICLSKMASLQTMKPDLNLLKEKDQRTISLLKPSHLASLPSSSNNTCYIDNGTVPMIKFIEFKKLFKKLSHVRFQDISGDYEFSSRHIDFDVCHLDYDRKTIVAKNFLTFIRPKRTLGYHLEEDEDDLDLDGDELVHADSLNHISHSFVDWIAHILRYADKGSCAVAVTSFTKTAFGILIPILLLKYRILGNISPVKERILVIEECPSALKYHDTFLYQYIKTKTGRSDLNVTYLIPYSFRLESLAETDICYVSLNAIQYLTSVYGFDLLDLFKYFVFVEGLYTSDYLPEFMEIMSKYSQERHYISKPFIIQCGFALNKSEAEKKKTFCNVEIPHYTLQEESLKDRLIKQVFYHEDYKKVTKIKSGLLLETLNKDHKLDIFTVLLRDFYQREQRFQESILIIADSDDEVYELGQWLITYRRKISTNDSFLICLASRTYVSTNITEHGFKFVVINKNLIDSIMIDRVSKIIFVGSLYTKNETSASIYDVDCMKSMFPFTEIYLMQSQRERTNNNSRKVIASPLISEIQRINNWYYNQENLPENSKYDLPILKDMKKRISFTHQQLLDEMQLPFVCSEILLFGYVMRCMDTALTLSSMILIMTSEDLQNFLFGWQERFSGRDQVPKDLTSMLRTLEMFENQWRSFRLYMTKRRYVKRFTTFEELERSVQVYGKDRSMTFQQICFMLGLEDVRNAIASHLDKSELFAFADIGSWSPWEEFARHEYNTGRFGAGTSHPEYCKNMFLEMIFYHILSDPLSTTNQDGRHPGNKINEEMFKNMHVLKKIIVSFHPLIHLYDSISQHQRDSPHLSLSLFNNLNLTCQEIYTDYKSLYYYTMEAKLYRLCFTQKLDYKVKKVIRANSCILDQIWEMFLTNSSTL